jgi:hypothetical protein
MQKTMKKGALPYCSATPNELSRNKMHARRIDLRPDRNPLVIGKPSENGREIVEFLVNDGRQMMICRVRN